eukprot:gb/GECH01003472.1/.p1 GENE.gb/GECH01003472.1/~~gb/GECH01003472.1/.p1  ORF type:complete len:270 (+),score=78.29 gb/GECH01003472.1/:1-810(+)
MLYKIVWVSTFLLLLTYTIHLAFYPWFCQLRHHQMLQHKFHEPNQQQQQQRVGSASPTSSKSPSPLLNQSPIPKDDSSFKPKTMSILHRVPAPHDLRRRHGTYMNHNNNNNTDSNNNNRIDIHYHQNHDEGPKDLFHNFVGYRTNLVRVIGNLSYENRTIQDDVRKSDGIPLILNSCNIDDLNPYQKEWSVVAIRNLLQDNPDNQNAVAELQFQAVSSDSLSQLQQMGFETELESETQNQDHNNNDGDENDKDDKNGNGIAPRVRIRKK